MHTRTRFPRDFTFLSILLCLLAVVLSIVLTDQLQSQSKIRVPHEMLAQDSLKVWVYLNDKGSSNPSAIQKAAISPAALQRRALRAANPDTEFLDREVNRDFVRQVRSNSLRVVHTSRWLNAVSAFVTPGQLNDIAQLDCVKEIKPVAQFTRRKDEIDTVTNGLQKPIGPFPPEYGPCYPQLNQIQIPLLHDQGLSGEGIRILVLDTGFNTEHSAFALTDIEATYDFINDDDDVVDTDNLLGQQSHGTSTLGLIGGTEEGEMIGAAFGAIFLLAKTEEQAREVPAEEDHWVAGIEWGESLGAEVVSSSLGYTNWYTYADKDGNTAVTTVAADIAASLGMIIVASIGNDQRISPQPTLLAPSDGDSVIAVGAVDLGGEITHFSSGGPTADGRIKPDLCAMGQSNYIASYLGGYGTGSGTSYSAPLVAGVVALLLEARPEWRYGDIYRALTLTCTRAAAPDNVYGYGIVRALEALNYDGSAPRFIRGVTAYPNPFSDYVQFDFEVPPPGAVEIRIYTVAGEKIATVTRDIADPLPPRWLGTNDSGDEAAPGIYIAYVSAPGLSVTKKIFKTR